MYRPVIPAFLFVLGMAVPATALADAPATPVPAPIRAQRYLFTVSVHDADRIDALLSRAEALAKSTHQAPGQPGIALVLHGPELKLFSNRDASRNKALIDKAARLDAEQVIEIKACKTKMDELQIGDRDLPEFIEVVPYGPAEEQRLRALGYVYL
jgi:intracellular sulfur oxidation DsrE/DsrF family protein